MRTINYRLRFVSSVAIAAALCFLTTSALYADWETGARGGYNSNVDHSIKDPESDSYVAGYIAFTKGVTGESRLNWTMDGNLEVAGYLKNTDLSYGELTLAPALVYFLRHNWTVSVSPFVQGRAVKDSDQSAVTLGGKISMRERISPIFYLSQYYLYRNSSASSSVYSTWEHALGAVGGINWTKRFYTELGYEFSHGDAFRSHDDSIATETGYLSGAGRGRRTMGGGHATFSSTFDTVVFQEIVDRHAVGITFGFDWTKSFFTTAGYTYSTMKGDSGTSRDHATFVGLGYRF